MVDSETIETKISDKKEEFDEKVEEAKDMFEEKKEERKERYEERKEQSKNIADNMINDLGKTIDEIKASHRNMQKSADQK